MKNSQKGFIVPLMWGIVALLSVSFGAYIYVDNKKSVPLDNLVEKFTAPTTDNSVPGSSDKVDTPINNVSTNSAVQVKNSNVPETNNNITQPTITLITPNGGGTIELGKTVNIAYKIKDFSKYKNPEVSFWLVKNGELFGALFLVGNFTSDEKGNDTNTGVWKPLLYMDPLDDEANNNDKYKQIPAGDGYSLGIILVDNGQLIAKSLSNKKFKIVLPANIDPSDPGISSVQIFDVKNTNWMLAQTLPPYTPPYVSVSNDQGKTETAIMLSVQATGDESEIIMDHLVVPEKPSLMTFDQKFTKSGDGDWFTVTVNGTLLYEFLGSSFYGDTFHESEIPLGKFSGQTVDLRITLHGSGSTLSQVLLKNFKIISAK